MSDLKDVEKGSYKSEEKIALKGAEVSNQATEDHEKSAANGGDTVKIVTSTEKQDFCGLSKEELQQFANDPFWRKVRLILFIAFWVAWIAMLLAAILIIVVAPRCPERPKLQWWQKSLFYRVCPRTFKDSNGDGNGDFKGLESKINYIHDDLNSDAIILTPIFKSKYNDLGFDITSLDNLNEEVFGDEKAFKSLLAKAHKKNLKVVIDFVVNNVDKNNAWWTNEDTDKFVWRKSQQETLQSLYNKDSWNKNNDNFFYSTLSADHPDINLENKDVFSYIENSLKKWLGFGVDGIRIPHAAYLVESNATISEENRKFSEGTFKFLKKISKIVNDYEDKVLIADLGDIQASDEQVAELFENGVNLVDSLNLADKTPQSTLNKVDLYDRIEKVINQTASQWLLWNLGNEDTSRFGDDVETWRLRNMLGLLLKGSSVVYYGNELAIQNSNIANTRDKYMNRDMFRAPMIWEDKSLGGFTEGDSSWIDVDKSQTSAKCVLCQLAGEKTPLHFFQNLTKLRKEPSFQWGSLKMEAVDHHKLIIFIRWAPGFPGYLVVLNTHHEYRATEDVKRLNSQLPDEAEIVLATENSEKSFGNKVKLNAVGLPPKSGLVLKWEWKDWDKKE